jgi:hypothetical protein
LRPVPGLSRPATAAFRALVGLAVALWFLAAAHAATLSADVALSFLFLCTLPIDVLVSFWLVSHIASPQYLQSNGYARYRRATESL